VLVVRAGGRFDGLICGHFDGQVGCQGGHVS
jgi:hypothetical protein